MSDERTGRELTPRPEEPAGAIAPREPALPQPSTAPGERFSAGEQAHTVGLTEERAAQIVKQSGNARMVAFLAALHHRALHPRLLAVRHRPARASASQGRMHGRAEPAVRHRRVARLRPVPGQLRALPRRAGPGRRSGPPLNDQAKLYNAVTATGAAGQRPPQSRLHPVGADRGRALSCAATRTASCPPGSNPRARSTIARSTRSSPGSRPARTPSSRISRRRPKAATGTPPPAVTVQGWRDPNFTPPPDATPVPACWRAPASTASTAPATPAPVTNPGTAANPRVIELADERSADLDRPDHAAAGHEHQRRPGRDGRVPHHQQQRASTTTSTSAPADRALVSAARTPTCPASSRSANGDADVHLHVRQRARPTCSSRAPCPATIRPCTATSWSCPDRRDRRRRPRHSRLRRPRRHPRARRPDGPATHCRRAPFAAGPSSGCSTRMAGRGPRSRPRSGSC